MSREEFSLDEIEVGHEFSPLSYTVGQELVRKYVEVVGDEDLLHRDLSYAQGAGYGGIVAPPTIAALYVLKAYRTNSPPPPGGVHVRQKFKFYRPIIAGDTLHVQAKVTDKYVRQGRRFLVIESLAQNQTGEDVVRSESTSFWAQ